MNPAYEPNRLFYSRSPSWLKSERALLASNSIDDKNKRHRKLDLLSSSLNKQVTVKQTTIFGTAPRLRSEFRQVSLLNPDVQAIIQTGTLIFEDIVLIHSITSKYLTVISSWPEANSQPISISFDKVNNPHYLGYSGVTCILKIFRSKAKGKGIEKVIEPILPLLLNAEKIRQIMSSNEDPWSF